MPPPSVAGRAGSNQSAKFRINRQMLAAMIYQYVAQPFLGTD